MNIQKISNNAFRIIDLCHQIASGEYSEKGKARREREIMRLIEQMQIEAEADEGYVSIHFKTNPNTERGKLLMDSLILGLTEIEHSYSKRYLKVKVREV